MSISSRSCYSECALVGFWGDHFERASREREETHRKKFAVPRRCVLRCAQCRCAPPPPAPRPHSQWGTCIQHSVHIDMDISLIRACVHQLLRVPCSKRNTHPTLAIGTCMVCEARRHSTFAPRQNIAPPPSAHPYTLILSYHIPHTSAPQPHRPHRRFFLTLHRKRHQISSDPR